MSDLKYWIALSLLPEIGPVGAKKLLSVFGHPGNIFKSDLNDLMAVDGMSINKAKKIREFSCWKVVEEKLGMLQEKGIRGVHLGDESYPEMLREIDGPPVVLFVKGDIRQEDRFSVAVVGSRKLTHYGASVAETLSTDLASAGLTVVSGMARGVDSLSHRGALGAGGRTIAVLGSGIDIPYPPENKNLMDKIAGSGCVVSEFFPGTPPDKDNFPRRNRIISGLSLGVIVIEATSDSGALLTARYAADQGREVFAVPGNINSANSEGTNELIRKGAVLVRRAGDVIEELAPVLKGFIREKGKVRTEVTEDEKRVCSLLSGEPKQIDSISRESGLPASKALGILLGLELKGAVKQITGKRFYLA
jgi:DNA processing protein